MARRETDRNLLFGILALQMDFITRDALIGAMNAWALEKHRRLGEVLVERGSLDPQAWAMLEPMVDLHVRAHRDDPAASLEALSSVDSVASDFRGSVTDAEVLESLATLRRPATPDPEMTESQALRDPGRVDPDGPEPGPSSRRYRKVREHARGGLGVVFVARDEELNRDVALKEIQPRHADQPHHRAKFVLEAEVTGGLEHPGIVPVYGLGRHDDGRPFYAMRFVRGDSLGEAVARFHADASLASDPGARALALQKLLRRFGDVCNAVAYAHSRGVLHRDLKPQNVMVGQYGETLVVDWGLAKPMGRREDGEPGPAEATLRPASGSGSAETMPGSLVGTPSFMSPEQAAGRLDLLGPASDVYGLGATLYHLLTGRAPFQGPDLSEVLRKVQAGEFPRPRDSKPWLDPALEAIPLKAMAREPGGRYANARALAEDVERWVAGEPVSAYPEPIARRLGRWARRHRTALAAASTAAVVAAILLGAIAWQRFTHRQRTDATALALFDQADRLAAEARDSGDPARWIKAIAEARRAVDQLETGGSPPLRLKAAGRLEAFQAEEHARLADLRMVDALDEARLLGANIKVGGFDVGAKHDAYMAAFRAYRIDIAVLRVEEAAGRIEASPIADDLLAALDAWATESPRNLSGTRLAAIVRAAGTSPWRTSVRETLVRGDATSLRALCEREENRKKLGPWLRNVFNALKKSDPAASFPLLEAIRRENPSDFWINHDIGMVCREEKPAKTQDAIRFLSIAVALRPRSPGAHFNLGNVMHDQNRLSEAIASYREAIRLDPGYAQAHCNLGVCLLDLGRFEEALASLSKAISLDPNSAEAYNNRGIILGRRGENRQAIASFREAIRLKPAFDAAYCNLGVALRQAGELDQAIAAYREAIRLKPGFAFAHNNLGNALRDRGNLDESIASYRDATRLDPDYALAYCNLGIALCQRGSLKESLDNYIKGDEIGSRQQGWASPSGEWVRQARRLVELEAKLPAIARREKAPGDASERLALADLCYQKGMQATSARFFDEAFAEQPDLSDDLVNGYRYNAACAASLAGSGSGKDEPPPDQAARIVLRGKALGWLRDDMRAWVKTLDGKNEPNRKQAMIKALGHWKVDADLASIRDEAGLAKLPEGEREAFRALWADVEALRLKAGGAK